MRVMHTSSATAGGGSFSYWRPRRGAVSLAITAFIIAVAPLLFALSGGSPQSTHGAASTQSHGTVVGIAEEGLFHDGRVAPVDIDGESGGAAANRQRRSRPRQPKGSAFSLPSSYDPSDPPPAMLWPPVAVPEQADEAWAADFIAGAALSQAVAPTIQDVLLPFGEALLRLRVNGNGTDNAGIADGRIAEAASASPEGHSSGQLLMAELRHVWRQSRFALEVMACAYTELSPPKPASAHRHVRDVPAEVVGYDGLFTDFFVRRHTALLAMALEAVGAEAAVALGATGERTKGEEATAEATARWRGVRAAIAAASTSADGAAHLAVDDAAADVVKAHPLVNDQGAFGHRFYGPSLELARRLGGGSPNATTKRTVPSGAATVVPSVLNAAMNDVALDQHCVRRALATLGESAGGLRMSSTPILLMGAQRPTAAPHSIQYV